MSDIVCSSPLTCSGFFLDFVPQAKTCLLLFTNLVVIFLLKVSYSWFSSFLSKVGHSLYSTLLLLEKGRKMRQGRCASKKCTCKKGNTFCGPYRHPGRHCVNINFIKANAPFVDLRKSKVGS